MIYYRCECGKNESWSSMGAKPCFRCKDCGTDMASGPTLHREPEPHSIVVCKVETDEGTHTLSACRWCMRKKKDLLAAGEPISET